MASACASSAIAAVAISTPSSQKNGSPLGTTKAYFLSGRKLKVNNITAPVGGRSATTVCAAADPDRPLWFPGSTPPTWLDGSLPGDFGFDPLGLEGMRIDSEDYDGSWGRRGAAVDQWTADEYPVPLGDAVRCNVLTIPDKNTILFNDWEIVFGLRLTINQSILLEIVKTSMELFLKN